jgi:predicted transposase YdaD
MEIRGGHQRYHYKIVRLWQEDPEVYLTAGVELVPLAPLANVSAADLPNVVERMKSRINPEAPAVAAKLWTATFLLMGLRYLAELIASCLEGVQVMHQSTTYELILNEGRKEGREEGRLREARRMLRLMGTKRFGEPDPAVLEALEEIDNIDRLEALGERILLQDLKTWDDLLHGS